MLLRAYNLAVRSLRYCSHRFPYPVQLQDRTLVPQLLSNFHLNAMQNLTLWRIRMAWHVVRINATLYVSRTYAKIQLCLVEHVPVKVHRQGQRQVDLWSRILVSTTACYTRLDFPLTVINKSATDVLYLCGHHTVPPVTCHDVHLRLPRGLPVCSSDGDQTRSSVPANAWVRTGQVYDLTLCCNERRKTVCDETKTTATAFCKAIWCRDTN